MSGELFIVTKCYEGGRLENVATYHEKEAAEMAARALVAIRNGYTVIMQTAPLPTPTASERG